MQKRKRIGAALAALAFSTGAAAQAGGQAEGGSNPAANFYIGAGVGQAHWRPGCPGSAASCDDTNTSLHAFAGYQLNRFFAAEAAFTNYGKATGSNVEVKGRGWEASLVGSWPIGASLSLLGRLGVYRGVVKGGGVFAGRNESNYGPTYGVGAQLDLTQNLALRGEWQAFPGVGGSTITDSDVNVLSVSALWRFR